MGKQVFITGITGASPYDIYLCQSDGSDCIFIDRINTVPYDFIIPPPYDQADTFSLKVFDINGCVIAGSS